MAKVGRSEKAILNDTLVSVTAVPETIAWRNNTGQAWAGQRVRLRPGSKIVVDGQTYVANANTVLILNAQPVTFGLPGSGDILGATAGRPLSIEVKDATGRQSEQQKAFQRAWEAAGGVYLLVRDPDEAAQQVSALNPLSVLG